MCTFLFLLFSVLLLCSFFRLKELFQVKNGLTTSLLFFFWKCQKFGSVAKRRKNEDGLMEEIGSKLQNKKRVYFDWLGCNLMTHRLQNIIRRNWIVSKEVRTVMFSTTKLLSTLRGTQRQFSENFCSQDDLRSRIFGTFFVKFLACLPLLGFSNI